MPAQSPAGTTDTTFAAPDDSAAAIETINTPATNADSWLATSVYLRQGKFEQTGGASWYASKFQGRRTANGERYDSRALTAAHRTLPFGSYARVTSLATARSVVVRINDRGPFIRERVIDLSYAAAAALGLPRTAGRQVRIESLRTRDDMQASLDAGPDELQ
jgi:rare lipoprotein A